MLRRPLPAAALVLVLYAGLALLNDPGGYLGTDTGAKVATLDAMVESGRLRPVVGYWAEQWDPEGAYHPLLDTLRNEDGEWVNVTTLPMLVAAYPLYAVGGYRFALALPMLGSLLAAFATRDVARQVGSEAAGWRAFWLVAVASPMTIYALDLWEHSLGAGLMVASFALLLRHAGDRGGALVPTVAGLLLGASAAMRTETFAFAFVAVGGVCVLFASRRRWLVAFRTGAAASGAFAAVWLLNGQLEAQLGGNLRSDRAAGALGDGLGDLGLRAEEAAITSVGMPAGAYPTNVLIGTIALLSLALGARLLARGERRAGTLALASAAVCYLLAFADGLTFVPGALVAAPVTVFALRAGGARSEVRLVAAAAGAVAVVTWLFQFTGGALPQWGGRYVLAPALLMLALGAVAADHIPRSAWRVSCGLSVATAVFGAAWLSQRSHDVDRFFDELAARPEDVIISENGFLVRESGPAYEERRYLSVGREEDLAGAARVARASGADVVGVLSEDRRPPRPLGEPVSSDRIELLGVELWVHTFDRG